MINPSSSNEEPSVQESLVQLSAQLGQCLNRASVDLMYQKVEDLLREGVPPLFKSKTFQLILCPSINLK
jgi:hypothetical protein